MRYLAKVGLNYGDPEKRVEPGEVVDDLPETAIDGLLAAGAVEPEEQATEALPEVTALPGETPHPSVE